jgi:L-lactate dehydrogenase complex protein LldE
VIEGFELCDYVVAPSGSCGGMMARHYPDLFRDDPVWLARAERFASKCHELISFLTDVMKIRSVDAQFNRRVTYHDSCSGLRELSIHDQPRQLLQSVKGLTLVEMQESDVCCGFGGTFAVKYSEISDAIVSHKVEKIEESQAPVLLAGDLGCLMNMAGKLARKGSKIEVRHVAEILAGMTDVAPIAARSKEASE